MSETVVKNKKAKDPLAGYSPLEKIYQLKVEDAKSRLENLTPRELEIINMMKNGTRSRIIAESLGISTKTLDIHRGNILRKLHTKSLVFATDHVKLLEAHALLSK